MAFAKKKQPHPVLRELALPVVSFAAVAVLAAYGIGGVGSGADKELFSMVEQSVTRAAIQCYALEGEYPPDLDYLIENYGLSIDSSKYSVYYENIGGNLLPQVRVFSADGGR